MVFTNFGGEDLVDVGRQGVGALGLSGHEKEVAITALFMEIELHVGLPLVEQAQSSSTLRMLMR